MDYWQVNDTNSSSLTVDDVVKFNGTKQNPIHLNPVVLFFNLLACFVGIPLNAAIIVLMLSLRRLRRKTRNIFSLGLIWSNLSAFVPVNTEFVYFVLRADEICLVYVSIVGLPCVLFMINALMSLADRYAAIVHPLWHKQWITVPFAICAQLFGSLFIAILYKILYVFHVIPLNCEIQMMQVS